MTIFEWLIAGALGYVLVCAVMAQLLRARAQREAADTRAPDATTETGPTADDVVDDNRDGEEAKTSWRDFWRDAVDSVGEGQLADHDQLTAAEMFRLQQKFSLSVAETPRSNTLTYSLFDIDRLTEWQCADWQRVQREWDKWNRKNVAFGSVGLGVWCVAAAISSYCLVRSTAVSSVLGPWVGLSSSKLSYGIGVVVGLGVLVKLPRLLGTLSAGPNWDSYSEGYSEGLRQGVTRALGITPEQEQEMSNDLLEARIAQVHLDRWKGTQVPCGKQND